MSQEEHELMQEMAQETITELYKWQFLSHGSNPTQFFIDAKLEDKIVRLDDVGRAYEEMIIRLGWQAILDEGKKKQSKYARVARVFLPALRKIYYAGYAKHEAQLLMEEMMLQSTVPFNDLDNHFGGDDYTELDSYTGQPLDQITPMQERMDLGDKTAPIIPQFSDGLTARITRAYDGELAIQATNASRENYDVSEEVWYEDRDRDNGPIQQERDLMFHLNMGEVYALIHTFRSMWNKINQWGERVIFWWLKEIAHNNYEPQNLLAVLLAFELDYMLPLIPCHFPKGSSLLITLWPKQSLNNLQQLYDLFGDDIRSEFIDLYDVVTDKEGLARDMLTDDALIDIAKGFENEIIATFKGSDIKHTRIYASGVFNALATGEADLTGAGYKNWRWNKSKQGSQAFDFAYCQAKFESANDRDAYKLAWSKFWGAGFIVRIHPDGLTVASEGNGKTRKVSWSRAADEIATYLIRLTADEKERLVRLLTDKNWGAELVYVLA